SVRDAMHGSPELKTLDEQTVEDMTKSLAAAMRIRLGDFPEDMLHLMSMMVLRTSIAILDHCMMEYYLSRDEQRLSQAIEELIKILTGYLSHYVE
nr:hypothetical protein [Deltaproteobacteria bacterium]